MKVLRWRPESRSRRNSREIRAPQLGSLGRMQVDLSKREFDKGWPMLGEGVVWECLNDLEEYGSYR